MAERLAYEFAKLIGVPAARVDLAVRDERPGIIVEDARWKGGALHHGRVLMTEVDENYDPDNRAQAGHNVEQIQAALARFAPPPEARVPTTFRAFDVFTGYLTFDSLVAHVDRHDRNWAVLVRPAGEEGPDALCASFDHAASLGFTLSADRQGRYVEAGEVAHWASRGRASRFEHRAGTPWATLVDVAAAAADLCAPDVRLWWHDRVRGLHPDAVRGLVASAPRLAGTTRRFLNELITINRGRLLDVLN